MGQARTLIYQVAVGETPPFYRDCIGSVMRYAALGGGYCTYPLLTHQPAGYSQIGLKHDDKSQLVERAWRKHLVK